jgi:hypothetical protein
MRDISPCGKGEGQGKQWQYPGPLFGPGAFEFLKIGKSGYAASSVSENHSFREH